jgi:phospholipid/cholesterol/gamma-HCH transport system substrate-binding protein
MNRNYIALGIFGVVTVGLLLVLASNVGALGGPKGNHYEVRLPHAAGLVDNNAVKVAGVQIGVIHDIRVEHDIAVLELVVDEDIQLHEDAIAIVRAKSLLGEKYLQLDPGTIDKPLLPAGSEIQNVRKVFEIDQVLNSLQPILGEGDGGLLEAVTPLARRIDKLLASAMGENGEAPVITKEEIQQTLDDVQETLDSVNRIVQDNEQAIGDILQTGSKLITDERIPRIMANVDRITARAADDLPTILDKVDRSLTDVNRLTATLTPENVQQIENIVDDLEKTSDNLRKLSDDLAGVGDDLKPILKYLNKILKVVAGIDELTVRKFVQEEGFRVNLKAPKDIVRRIEELERQQ